MGNLRELAGISFRAAALATAFAGLPLSAASPASTFPASAPVVAYRIDVGLDPETKMLEGKERLVWRNPSNDTVSELRFHLYLNAFKNDLSTFMRESGGRLRGAVAGRKADDWGWIDVLSMTTDRGEDLQPRARFVQPDGNDPEDETVLAVPLPRPVPPRGEITLDIAFRARLPRIFARTGFVRDYFLVGQWFPKLGVYEPAGMRGRARGGWNAHALHANSEFYADFGSYDVSITVPSRFIVGATGKRVAETRAGGKTTYRYAQDNVHDFAWTADPRFQVTEFTFDPARDIPAGWAARASRELGMPVSELALKPVACRLLLQPGHEGGRERYLRATKESIAFFGLWYGVYPYETLTIVGPSRRRHRVGRHGVPDLLHGRRRAAVPDPLAPRRAAPHRARDRPRVRPPVLVRDRRLERVRGGLARRGSDRRLGASGDDPRLWTPRHRGIPGRHRLRFAFAGPCPVHGDSQPRSDPSVRLVLRVPGLLRRELLSESRHLHGSAPQRPRPGGVRPRPARLLPGVEVPASFDRRLFRGLRASLRAGPVFPPPQPAGGHGPPRLAGRLGRHRQS